MYLTSAMLIDINYNFSKKGYIMIDSKFINDYSDNIIILWIRKIITSLFYFRGYRILYPEKPMYAPKAVRFIEDKLNDIHRVFEFGSGISSIWYAERIEEYTVVEHDQSWYNQVTSMLNDKKLTNVKVLFTPTDESGANFNWEKEWPYYSILKHAPDNPEYRHYISQIDQFPDKYFDCIIIDGRERLGCLVHSMSKLAEDGMIIFDDSAMDKFQEMYDILDGWHYKSFRFGLGHTTFFARKKSVLMIS